jgi:hypothetical protein
LSVMRRNIISLHDHRAECSSIHHKRCKEQHTCGPKSPHDDDPRDETQTLVGPRDACKMPAIFSTINRAWLRIDPKLSAKSIDLTWPDCNAWSTMCRGTRLVRSKARQYSSSEDLVGHGP